MRIERVILGKDDVEQALLDYIVKKTADQWEGGLPTKIDVQEAALNDGSLELIVEVLP